MEALDICINCLDKDDVIVRQLASCLNMYEDNYEDYEQCSEFSGYDVEWFERTWKYKFGQGEIDAYDLYPILLRLISDFELCGIENNYYSENGSMYVDANLFTSKNRTVINMEVNYSEGDLTITKWPDTIDVRNIITWESLREKIELESNNKGVEISWVNADGKLIPNENNRNFCYICDDVFDEALHNFAYWDNAEEISQFELDDKLLEISSELIFSLYNNAVEKQYMELANRLKDFFENKYY